MQKLEGVKDQKKEIDGGVYDNPDVTIREALTDIVGDLKAALDHRKRRGKEPMSFLQFFTIFARCSIVTFTKKFTKVTGI